MGGCSCRHGLYYYVSSLSPGHLVAIFTVVNILGHHGGFTTCRNYLDRGIVPGAFESLGQFVSNEFHVNNTDTYTGVLQSSFIGGYSVASLTFGHLVHIYPPFKLMSVGLAIWCVAVVLSGLAPSFAVLVCARVLSGVGEASFQCVVPPYIDDRAPPKNRAAWLSVFYMAIPVGTALGYSYGGAVGASSLGWRWAFIMEAFPMLPLIVLMWFLPYSPTRAKVRRGAGRRCAWRAGCGMRVCVQVIAEVEDELEADADPAVPSTPGQQAVPSTPGQQGILASGMPTPVGFSSPASSTTFNTTATASAGKAALTGYGSTNNLLTGGDASGRPSNSGSESGSGLLGHIAALTSPRKAATSRASADVAGGEYAAMTDTAPLIAHARGPGTPSGSMSEGADHGAAMGHGKTQHPHLHVHVGHGHHVPHHVPPTTAEVMREVNDELRAVGDTAALADTVTPADHKPTFFQELYITLGNPVYMSIVFGYAGFTAVVAGLGTFAPTFVLDLKLVSTQTLASLAAGAVVSVAGAIGTPWGGWLVDKGTKALQLQVDAWRAERRSRGVAGNRDSLNRLDGLPAIREVTGRESPALQAVAASLKDAPSGLSLDGDPDEALTEDDATRADVLDVKVVTAMYQAVILSVVGSILTVGSIYVTAATTNLAPFLVVLALGTVLLMGTTAGINLALMAAVPAESRSFAIGISTLLLHALGDVPAPPVIGFIADDLSPKYDCVGTSCQRSASGLRLTLAVTSAWLFWPIVCWAFAYVAARSRMMQRISSGWYDDQLKASANARAAKRAQEAAVLADYSRGRRAGSMDDSRVKLLDFADESVPTTRATARSGTTGGVGGGYAPPIAIARGELGNQRSERTVELANSSSSTDV